MKGRDKTKDQLITELEEMRQRISKLEAIETDGKKATEALRESEASKRAIMDAMPDVVALVDESYITLDINEAMARRFGKRKEELIGTYAWDLIPPDLAKSRREHFEEVFKIGQMVRFEDESKGVHFENIVYPVSQEEGKVTKVAVIARDTTVRKRMEMALLEERNRAWHYWDLARTMLLAIDANGKVSDVNIKGCEILEYDRKDIIGKDWFDNFIPQRMREDVKAIFSKIMSGIIKPLEHVEGFSIISKSGKERLISWHNSVRIDENGRITGTLSSGEDITERKQAEKALLFMQYAVDNAADTMVCVDKEGRFLSVNKAFCHAVGYSQEELLSMKVSDIDPEHSAKKWPEFWKELKQRGSLTFESHHRSKDERSFPIEAVVTYFEYEGKEYHCGFARNITERKKVEEALRVAEENFRHSLDESPLGIRIVSAEGELLYANQAILDIYGYSSIDELEAVPRQQRYTRKSYIEHRKRIENRKLGKPVLPNYEISIVRKDGKVRHLSVFRKEVIWGGKTQFQTLYQDITERREAEGRIKGFSDAVAGAINGREHRLSSYTKSKDR